jgi:hypothetical protein
MRAPPNARWTAEEDELLTKLFEEGGYSCSQMAAHFPRHPSRNSVIGRLHRLGLLRERRPREKGLLPLKPTRVNDKRPAKKPKTPPVAPDIEGLKALAVSMRQAEPPNDGIDLLELESHHCRYVLNEASPWKFCGRQKQEGSSMCEFHHSRCYVRPGSQRIPTREAA